MLSDYTMRFAASALEVVILKSFSVHSLCRFLLCGMFAVLPLACSGQPKLPPLSTDAVILAFGDSLTFGTGAGEQQSYPEVLAGLTGRKVVNAGVPGEVSKDGLERLPGVLEEVRPDLLILCHGGNDMLRRQDQQQLRDNLVNMLEMARDQGIAVLMVAVPEPGLALKPPALYQELAKEFAIPLEKEVIVSILKKSELKSDQVHPNAAGYQRMAEAFADLLRKSGALL